LSTNDDRKCVSRIEEQSLQQNRTLGLLQKENSDLRAVHSHLAAESASLGETTKALEQLLCLLQMEVAGVRKIAALSAQFAPEVTGLREKFTEDIAKALLEQTKSGEGAADAAKPNFSPARSVPRMQFMLISNPPERGEMPVGGIISHLPATCGGNVHEEAPVDLLDLPSVRSMTSARDTAVFFGSVAKDPIRQNRIVIVI
jgi:hypothetical protein